MLAHAGAAAAVQDQLRPQALGVRVPGRAQGVLPQRVGVQRCQPVGPGLEVQVADHQLQRHGRRVQERANAGSYPPSGLGGQGLALRFHWNGPQG